MNSLTPGRHSTKHNPPICKKPSGFHVNLFCQKGIGSLKETAETQTTKAHVSKWLARRQSLCSVVEILLKEKLVRRAFLLLLLRMMNHGFS